MKLREAIERVTKHPDNEASYGKMEEDFSQMFGFDLSCNSTWWSDSEGRNRLKGYWLDVWLCTDTWVGLSVWFLDNVFVFTIDQTARKSPGMIRFKDKDAHKKVGDFVKSFELPEEFEKAHFVNLDQDVQAAHREYENSVVHASAIYNGQVVNIRHLTYEEMKERAERTSGYIALEKSVWIFNPDASMDIVRVADLEFPMLIDGRTNRTKRQES